MEMIRIAAGNPYFVVAGAHTPISNLYTTHAFTDQQFHNMPGGYYFSPEEIFFAERV